MRKLLAFSFILSSTLAFAAGDKVDPRGESRKDPARQQKALEQARAEFIRYKLERRQMKQDRALRNLFQDRDHDNAFADLREAQMTGSKEISTPAPTKSAQVKPEFKPVIHVRDVVNSARAHSRESFAIVHLLKVWMGPRRTVLDLARHDLVFAVFRTRTLDREIFDGLSPERPSRASFEAANRVLIAMEHFMNALTGTRVGPGLSAASAITDMRTLANDVQSQSPEMARFIDDVLLLLTEPTPH